MESSSSALSQKRGETMGFYCCCVRVASIEALPEEAQELLRSLGPMLCDLCHSVLCVVIKARKSLVICFIISDILQGYTRVIRSCCASRLCFAMHEM